MKVLVRSCVCSLALAAAKDWRIFAWLKLSWVNLGLLMFNNPMANAGQSYSIGAHIHMHHHITLIYFGLDSLTDKNS